MCWTICLSVCLLALTAGMYLLAKTKKEELGSFFKWISWLIISGSLIAITCCMCMGIGRMLCHNGGCGSGMQCHGMEMGGMKGGHGCAGMEMGACCKGGGHGMMGGCEGHGGKGKMGGCGNHEEGEKEGHGEEHGHDHGSGPDSAKSAVH